MSMGSDEMPAKPKRELKMWLAVRQDITMSTGKFGAQAGHAFGRLYRQVTLADPARLDAYLADDEPKVTVKVKNEAALARVHEEAKSAGIPVELIRDAGRSELEPGTATVAAFGPAFREDLPAYLARLQVLKD